MPNQLLTNVVPQIMAQALPVLRKNSKFPRLVNRNFEDEAAELGDRIDIPIIDDATVRTVNPAATYPTAVTVQPTKVQLVLDWWREVPFTLEDKELSEANAGILPGRAGAAIEALARAVDVKIAALNIKLWKANGTAGTAPFATTLIAYVSAKRDMAIDLAPVDGRSVVLDPSAEANAMALPAFLQANLRGDPSQGITGEIGHRLGADWYMDQNIQTPTNGGVYAFTTLLVATAVAAGASEVQVRSTSSGPTLAAGDIFVISTVDTVANQYVCVTAAAVTGTLTTIPISPPARQAYVTTDTVHATLYGTHVANLYFHRNCFSWASRPIKDVNAGALGSVISSVVDPISGLAFRLEVSRQYKQTTWSWDILGGALCTRPELGARIMG